MDRTTKRSSTRTKAATNTTENSNLLRLEINVRTDGTSYVTVVDTTGPNDRIVNDIPPQAGNAAMAGVLDAAALITQADCSQSGLSGVVLGIFAGHNEGTGRPHAHAACHADSDPRDLLKSIDACLSGLKGMRAETVNRILTGDGPALH